MSTDNHVCKAVRQKSAQMFTISPKIRYREQMEKNSHALGFNGSGSSRKCDIQVNFAGGSAQFHLGNLNQKIKAKQVFFLLYEKQTGKKFLNSKY